MLVAAAAYFVFVPSGSGGSTSSQSSTQSTDCFTTTTFSAGTVTTSTTIACGLHQPCPCYEQLQPWPSSSSSTPTSSTFIPTSSTLSTTISTSNNTLRTFNAHYEWSENQTYSGGPIVISATGSFTITIDMSEGSGMATGQGTVDFTQTGVCTGHDSVDYTFPVYGDINPIANNLTLAFGLATPASSTVAVTCQGSGGSNSGYSWSSVIPEQVTLPANYGAKAEGTIGQVTYEITLA